MSNLYISGMNYCLQSTLNERFFKNFTTAGLFTFARRMPLKKYYFMFRFDGVMGFDPGVTFAMALHCLLDYLFFIFDTPSRSSLIGSSLAY